MPSKGRFKVLSVCGGHERTVAKAGLRPLLQDRIELLAGPGCPVCVCPEEDLAFAICAALSGVPVFTFTDMLFVPVWGLESKSLAEARAKGAEVHAVTGPKEAAVAARKLNRDALFLAVGFETTMAPTAACLVQDWPKHLFVLLSGRRTAPVVEHLFSGKDWSLDGLIAPGHVATITGEKEWRDLGERLGLPVAVAGFEAKEFLQALHALEEAMVRRKASFVNAYPWACRPEGNPWARQVLEKAFFVEDAPWRGIGEVPFSGYVLRPPFDVLDARSRWSFAFLPKEDIPFCKEVLSGELFPASCPSFGKACSPKSPLGAPMVSEEGSCRIIWEHGSFGNQFIET